LKEGPLIPEKRPGESLALVVKGVGKRKNAVVFLTKIVASIFFSCRFRLRASGMENVPRRGAFILLPKHQRWEDVPLLSLAAPRLLYFMAKVELFSNPLLGRYISALGGIPVNRARPMESRDSFRLMAGLLQGGEGVVIFPEGTYYVGSVGAFQAGLVRYIHPRVEVPFIPVGIRYLPGRGRMEVRIVFGKPLWGRTFDRTGDLLLQAMNDVAALSGLGPDPVAGIRETAGLYERES